MGAIQLRRNIQILKTVNIVISQDRPGEGGKNSPHNKSKKISLCVNFYRFVMVAAKKLYGKRNQRRGHAKNFGNSEEISLCDNICESVANRGRENLPRPREREYAHKFTEYTPLHSIIRINELVKHLSAGAGRQKREISVQQKPENPVR